MFKKFIPASLLLLFLFSLVPAAPIMGQDGGTVDRIFVSALMKDNKYSLGYIDEATKKIVFMPGLTMKGICYGGKSYDFDVYHWKMIEYTTDWATGQISEKEIGSYSESLVLSEGDTTIYGHDRIKSEYDETLRSTLYFLNVTDVLSGKYIGKFPAHNFYQDVYFITRVNDSTLEIYAAAGDEDIKYRSSIGDKEITITGVDSMNDRITPPGGQRAFLSSVYIDNKANLIFERNSSRNIEIDLYNLSLPPSIVIRSYCQTPAIMPPYNPPASPPTPTPTNTATPTNTPTPTIPPTPPATPTPDPNNPNNLGPDDLAYPYEVATGEMWEGRPVYRRHLTGQVPAVGDQLNLFDGVYAMIRHEGYVMLMNDWAEPLPAHELYIQVFNGTVFMKSNFPRLNSGFSITVYYTKP